MSWLNFDRPSWKNRRHRSARFAESHVRRRKRPRSRRCGKRTCSPVGPSHACHPETFSVHFQKSYQLFLLARFDRTGLHAIAEIRPRCNRAISHVTGRNPCVASIQRHRAAKVRASRGSPPKGEVGAYSDRVPRAPQEKNCCGRFTDCQLSQDCEPPARHRPEDGVRSSTLLCAASLRRGVPSDDIT